MPLYHYENALGQRIVRAFRIGTAPTEIGEYKRVFTVPQINATPHKYRDENRIESLFGGAKEWAKAQREGEKFSEASWQPTEDSPENGFGREFLESRSPSLEGNAYTEALQQAQNFNG